MVTALATALGLSALLVWQRARTLGDAALLLALVPLFFAGRSFASYFAFAPWLALYAVNALERRATGWHAGALSAGRGRRAGRRHRARLAGADGRDD